MNMPFDSAFENDIKQLLTEVPPPVRAFFASGKVETVAKNLMQKNQLHIDQGAIMEREIILLLLGLKNPDEFTRALAEEAKLDQKTINSIVQDINTQIFVPLREEEMKTSQPAKPVIPQPQPRPQSLVTPPTAPAPVLPKGIYAPPLQSPRYFHLENKIAPPLRPLNAPRNSAPGERSALRNVLAAVTKEVPMPMNDEKLLEDHEEPRIEFNKTPPSIVSRIAPPPNLPGVVLHPPLTPQPRPDVAFGEAGPIIPKVEPPASPKPSVPAAPAKPYSGDPYREPIEP